VFGVEEAEKWQQKKVGEALGKLRRKGVIGYSPGRGYPGAGTPSTVSLIAEPGDDESPVNESPDRMSPPVRANESPDSDSMGPPVLGPLPEPTKTPKSKSKSKPASIVTNCSKSDDPQAVGVDATEDQEQPQPGDDEPTFDREQPHSDEPESLTPARDEEHRGDDDAFAEIMSAVDDGRVGKTQVMRLAMQVLKDVNDVKPPSNFDAVKELPDDEIASIAALVNPR